MFFVIAGNFYEIDEDFLEVEYDGELEDWIFILFMASILMLISHMC
jgi:hypothetical protein